MDDAMRDRIIEFIRDEYVEDEATEVAEATPLISGGLTRMPIATAVPRTRYNRHCVLWP